MGWKGFGRQPYLPNPDTSPGYVWSYFENQKCTPFRRTGIATPNENFTSQTEVENGSTIPKSLFRIS